VSSINPETVVSVLKEIMTRKLRSKKKEESFRSQMVLQQSMEWTRQCMESLLYLKQVSMDLY